MNWIQQTAICFHILLLLLDTSECYHYHIHGRSRRPRFYFHDPDASSSYLHTNHYVNQRRKKQIGSPRPPPNFPVPRPEWGRMWPTEPEFTLMKVAILDSGLLNWVGNDFETKLPSLVDDYLENGSKLKSTNNTDAIDNNRKAEEKKESSNLIPYRVETGNEEETGDQGENVNDNNYNENESIENDLIYTGNENAEQNKVDLKEDEDRVAVFPPNEIDEPDVFILSNNSSPQLEKFTPLKLTCFSLSWLLMHSIFYFDSLYLFNSAQNKDANFNF